MVPLTHISGESPELIELFATYTAGPTGIGSHFTSAAAQADLDAPLTASAGGELQGRRGRRDRPGSAPMAARAR